LYLILKISDLLDLDEYPVRLYANDIGMRAPHRLAAGGASAAEIGVIFAAIESLRETPGRRFFPTPCMPWNK
jgi:hypothetical protein